MNYLVIVKKNLSPVQHRQKGLENKLSDYFKISVQTVEKQLVVWKKRGMRRLDGSKALPFYCLWYAWCWWRLLTTGAKRSSSAVCRVASNKSKSSPSSERGRWSRSKCRRLWSETSHKSSMVSKHTGVPTLPRVCSRGSLIPIFWPVTHYRSLECLTYQFQFWPLMSKMFLNIERKLQCPEKAI